MNHDAIALAQLRGICAAFIDNRMSPLAFEQSVACAAEADVLRRAAAEPAKVWVAAVDTEDGGTTLHAAWSEDRMLAGIAQFCRDNWKVKHADDPVPEGDRQVIEAWFGDGHDWRVIQEVTILADQEATPT